MTPLTMEQRMTQHEMADERRFGQLERHLERQDGKLDMLLDRTVKVEDDVEDTQTRNLNALQAKSDFWRGLIWKVIAGIVVAFGAGLIGHWIH